MVQTRGWILGSDSQGHQTTHLLSVMDREIPHQAAMRGPHIGTVAASQQASIAMVRANITLFLSKSEG